MASNKKYQNKKYFQDAWLSMPEYKVWLAKDKEDNTKYRCTVCHKTKNISTAGQSAWSKHGEGAKHRGRVEKRKNFFKGTTKENRKKPSIDSNLTIDLQTDEQMDGQQRLEQCLTSSDELKLFGP